jgi:hypothetical protein
MSLCYFCNPALTVTTSAAVVEVFILLRDPQRALDTFSASSGSIPRDLLNRYKGFNLLRLIFLQKWKEKLKIWNSRNQDNFVFTFVSFCQR